MTEAEVVTLTWFSIISGLIVFIYIVIWLGERGKPTYLRSVYKETDDMCTSKDNLPHIPKYLVNKGVELDTKRKGKSRKIFFLDNVFLDGKDVVGRWVVVDTRFTTFKDLLPEELGVIGVKRTWEYYLVRKENKEDEVPFLPGYTHNLREEGWFVGKVVFIGKKGEITNVY